MAEDEACRDGWRQLLVSAWALVGLGLLVLAGLWLLGRISAALTPFVLAFVIVLVLRGSVNRLQGMGMPRTAGVLLSYLLAFGLVALLGLVVAPPLVSQLREFAQEAPQYYDGVQGYLRGLFDRYQALRFPGWAEEFIDNATRSIGNQFVDWSRQIANWLVTAGSGAVGFLLNVVMALVIGFFLLRDLPTMREELFSVFGSTRRREAQTIYVKIITVLGGYLRGQLIIAAIVGFLTFLGLWAVGHEFALVAGLITGIFNIIPYFGPIVGGAFAALTAALQAAQGEASLWLVVWSLLIVFAVQQIEGTLLSPRIMSEQVDLHPVLVIFSLLVGATLFGFVGLLLAIPVAAVFKGLFVYFFEKHMHESISRERGAIFREGRRSQERSSGGCASRAPSEPEQADEEVSEAADPGDGDASASPPVSPPEDEGGDRGRTRFAGD